MMNIKKEILKQILFTNYQNWFNHVNNVNPDENFGLEFDQNKENIIFKCISSYTHGVTCDGGKSETTKTLIGCIDADIIRDSIDELILKDWELTKGNVDELIDYTDNSRYFYIREENESMNEDYYYNADNLRTMFIPIEEICEHLMTFKYVKPMEDLYKNLKNISLDEINFIVTDYLAKELEEKLESKGSQTKPKI